MQLCQLRYEHHNEVVASWRCDDCAISRAFLCDRCHERHASVYPTHVGLHSLQPRRSALMSPQHATEKLDDDNQLEENGTAPSSSGVDPSPYRSRIVGTGPSANLGLTAHRVAAEAHDLRQSDAVSVPFVPPVDGDSRDIPSSSEYVTSRPWRFGEPIVAMYVTWNLAATDPPTDDSLNKLLKPCAHIVAVATQENGPYVGLSDSHARWLALVEQRLNGQRHLGSAWLLVHEIGMSALHLAVFARQDIFEHIGLVHGSRAKTGWLGGAFGNKGAVAVAFAVAQKTVAPLPLPRRPAPGVAARGGAKQSSSRFDPAAGGGGGGEGDERSLLPAVEPCSGDRDFITLLIVNAHLPPDQDAVERRNAAYASIVQHLLVGRYGPYPGMARAQDSAPSRDCTEEFDVTLFGGDLNYRVNGTKYAIEQLVETHRSLRAVLTMNDQLTIQRQRLLAFAGFDEGNLFFPPTYKLSKDPRTRLHIDRYDTSPKQRLPAYCDRVLYKRSKLYSPRCLLLHYSDVQGVTMTSDHRPVAALIAVGTPTTLLPGGDAEHAYDEAAVDGQDERDARHFSLCCAPSNRSCITM